MGDRCELHIPSDGFIDADGVWHCWKCYKTDEYLNPTGEIIMKRSFKELEARVIAASTHRINVEIWELKGKKHILKHRNGFDYLSQAARYWDDLLHSLEKKSSI